MREVASREQRPPGARAAPPARCWRHTGPELWPGLGLGLELGLGPGLALDHYSGLVLGLDLGPGLTWALASAWIRTPA